MDKLFYKTTLTPKTNKVYQGVMDCIFTLKQKTKIAELKNLI